MGHLSLGLILLVMVGERPIFDTPKELQNLSFEKGLLFCICDFKGTMPMLKLLKKRLVKKETSRSGAYGTHRGG